MAVPEMMSRRAVRAAVPVRAEWAIAAAPSRDK
jgi:hypothetical protein